MYVNLSYKKLCALQDLKRRRPTGPQFPCARLLTRRVAWQDKLKASIHHTTDGLAVGAVRGTGLSMVATFGSALWWTLHPAATLSLLPKMGALVANSAVVGTTVGALAGIVIAGGASFVAQKTKKYAGDLSGMSRRGLFGLAACLGFVAPLTMGIGTMGQVNGPVTSHRNAQATTAPAKDPSAARGVSHLNAAPLFQMAAGDARRQKNNHPDKRNSPDKQNGQEGQRDTGPGVKHMFADAARAGVKVMIAVIISAAPQNFPFTPRRYGGITLN